MNISQDTLAILNNFATINQNIFIEEGNVIKTKTPKTINILASATLPDSFPKAFGVYELSKLINTLNMFDGPDIQFSDASMTIKQGKSSVRYSYTEPALLDAMKDYSKNIVADEDIFQFELSDVDFKNLQKSAKLFDVNNINIKSGNDNVIIMSAASDAISDSNSNKFSVEIDSSDLWRDNVSVNIKLDSFKFLAGNYKVTVSSKTAGAGEIAVCKFENTDRPELELTYIVAGEFV